METPYDRLAKFYANCFGHMTKMATTPIHVYGKNPLKSFSLEPEIVSEYDQEIPQSQTADNPVASRGRAAQPSRDTRKTN